MASSTPEHPLEVDPSLSTDSEFTDSDYSSGLESDTTSLITAARNHIFENGRRYHGYKEGKYMLPNDETEQDRMDLMHHCCLLALHGELFVAPVGKDWKPQTILDVGTGSGIWAIDMADQHPEAHVIGIDLSPIQPSWVPPNVSFVVDDVEETWHYQEGSFDFIFLRTLAGFISDWPKLYHQAFKALKPGGWIEMHDFGEAFSVDDGSVPPTSSLFAWAKSWEAAAIMSGRQHDAIAPGAAEALRELGCVDVGEKVIKIPCGCWPKGKYEKNLGLYWRQHILDGAEGLTLGLFTRILRWDKKEVDDFLKKFSADLKNPKYHAYSKLYCVYGRKPSKSQ